MTAARWVDPEQLGREASPDALLRLETAGESRLGGYAWMPQQKSEVPLLVAVHGISRDALGIARAFVPLAKAQGWALVAPEFDAERHGDYQRLGRVGRGPRADLALDDLVGACAARFGLAWRRRFFFGYSAGGQFVHRYLMAHPAQVHAAVVGAPGWFTLPDPKRAYPYGLHVGRELPGVRMVPADFLRTPVLVVVGDRDVDRDSSLRQSGTVDRLQGQDRLERAVRWTEAMNGLARRRDLPEPIRMRVLEAAGHGFAEAQAAGLVDEVEAFLCECGWMRDATPA